MVYWRTNTMNAELFDLEAAFGMSPQQGCPCAAAYQFQSSDREPTSRCQSSRQEESLRTCAGKLKRGAFGHHSSTLIEKTSNHPSMKEHPRALPKDLPLPIRNLFHAFRPELRARGPTSHALDLSNIQRPKNLPIARKEQPLSLLPKDAAAFCSGSPEVLLWFAYLQLQHRIPKRQIAAMLFQVSMNDKSRAQYPTTPGAGHPGTIHLRRLLQPRSNTHLRFQSIRRKFRGLNRWVPHHIRLAKRGWKRHMTKYCLMKRIIGIVMVW